MTTSTKSLSLQKQRQSKGSLWNKTQSHNTYSPSRLPPMLLYKIQPCAKCQSSEKGGRSLHETWGSQNWRRLALKHCKRIYNLMQRKALDKFAILTPGTSPNPPHLDPPAPQKNSKLSASAKARVEARSETHCTKIGLCLISWWRWGGAHFERTKAHV